MKVKTGSNSTPPSPRGEGAKPGDLARLVETAQPSYIREMLAFVWQEKKWLLLPLILVLLAAGFFVILSGTAAAPFIYAIF